MPRVLKLPASFKTEDLTKLLKIHGMEKNGLKILALKLLQDGKNLKEVGELLSKSVFTIKNWVNAFEEQGVESLLKEKEKNSSKKHQEPIKLKREEAPNDWNKTSSKSQMISCILDKFKSLWNKKTLIKN